MHDCRCRSCSSTTFVDPADDDTAAAEPAPERLVFHLQEEEPKILAKIAVVAPGIVVAAEEDELPKPLATWVVVEPGIVVAVVAVGDVRKYLAMVDVPPMDLEQPFAVVAVVVVAGQRTDQRMQLMPLKTV